MKNFETREGQLEYIILSLTEAQTILIDNIKRLEKQLEEEHIKIKMALALIDDMEMMEAERLERTD